MCAMHSTSREQHFKWPPAQLCMFPAGDVGSVPHRRSCPGERAASAGEHRADKGGGSETCHAEGAALPLSAAKLWLPGSGPLRTPVQLFPVFGDTGEAHGVPKGHSSPPGSPSPGGSALTAARGFNFPHRIKGLL